MADFYPVLSRAIAGLSDPTPDMRRAIYDRARSVLVAQLRGLDPPLSETEIARERLGLDETIARLEAELASRPAEPLDGLSARPAVKAPAAEKPVASVPSPGFQVPDARPGLPLPDAPPLPGRGPGRYPEEADPSRASPAFADAGAEPDTPPPGEEAPLAEPPAQERPRIGPPPVKERNPARMRSLVMIGAIGVVVAGIAGLAYRFRVNDTVPAGRPQETVAGPATPADNGAKINERIGADGAPATAGTGPAQPGPAAGPRSEVAVAQRAVLYIETAENPQQPRTVQGRAVWRLDSENVGSGQPVETVVSARIEIPDAGLSLLFTIRRNTDAAFPASHIVGLRFSRSFDDGNGVVREAGVPQFKADESERGAPLSAITSALGENLFVSALSNVPVEIERNLDVITKRAWIDIPVRFASGRRGIVAFEKGLSGDQALAEALNAWR